MLCGAFVCPFGSIILLRTAIFLNNLGERPLHYWMPKIGQK